MPGQGAWSRPQCGGEAEIPSGGKTVFHDLVKGPIAFQNEELDDLVLWRSDGSPTYHLAVVVDDITMGITHVIRGDDHVNNTPRQILIYQALGESLPHYAHVPMILGPDRTRLSKRHGATSVLAYREMGYLPHALLNALARLGWSYGDQEKFTVQELIEKFSLENVGKSAGIFNPEKLLDLNAQYIRESDSKDLGEGLIPFLERLGFKDLDKNQVAGAAETLRMRSKTLVEMAESARFYFDEDLRYEEKADRKFLKPDIAPLDAGNQSPSRKHRSNSRRKAWKACSFASSTKEDQAGRDRSTSPGGAHRDERKPRAI